MRLLLPTSHSSDRQIHLIFEYGKGLTFGAVKTSRANRFILTFDEGNAYSSAAEPLQRHFQEKGYPDLFVSSGWNLLESLPAPQRYERLTELLEILAAIGERTITHVEFASMSDRRLISKMVSTVFRSVDSAGFNEQELADILERLESRAGEQTASTFDISSLRKAASPPLVASALKALVRAALLTAADGGARFVSRLHFHSLPFHMIAIICLHGDANKQQVWSVGAQWRSVAAGASTASYRACSVDGRELRDVDIERIAPLQFRVGDGIGAHRVTVNASKPVASWTEDFEDSDNNVAGNITFFYTPVLVCRAPVRTVGLGDAISAAGLSRSVV